MQRSASLSLIAALGLALSAPSVAIAQDGADNEGHDPIVSVSSQDPEMNAAIAEARRTLPEFLKVVDRPPAGARDISFKYPLEGVEHIWVSNVSHRGNVLVGELDNDPAAPGYRLGQRVEVPLSQVSDWAWRGSDGVMRGHRTTRVLLKRIAPDEAAQIKAWLGWN